MHRIRLAAPLLGLGLILAACGSAGATKAPATSAPAATTAATTAPSEAAASAPPAAAGTTVNLGDTALGPVLVDGTGRTLYIFTADSGGKSVCNADCAANWPPLVGDAALTVGTGLDAADFATITRDDGSRQVSFYGMPLYYFAADTAAADTKGQGLAGKWYVVGADGKPIK